MLASHQAKVVSINISKGGIPKIPQEQVSVTEQGFEGDGHNHEKHCTPLQAVCLQDLEKLEELNRLGYDLQPGSTGENITVQGLDVNALPIGSRLHFSNGVLLEITKVRKPCYVLDEINVKLKEDIIGRCGVYAKVLTPGFLRTGEVLKVNK